MGKLVNSVLAVLLVMVAAVMGATILTDQPPTLVALASSGAAVAPVEVPNDPSLQGGYGVVASPPLVSPAAVVLPEVPTEVAIPWLPPSVAQWSKLFIDAGALHSVDPELIAIVALVESGGNPGAVSHSGAQGLMQVMPGTGAGIAGERGISGWDVPQLLDPATSIDFGAYYLAQQLSTFGRVDDPDWQSSVEMAAVAYNGGPGTASSGRLSNQTIHYRRWVGGMWRERHLPSSTTYDEWLVAGGRVLVEAAEARMASQ